MSSTNIKNFIYYFIIIFLFIHLNCNNNFYNNKNIIVDEEIYFNNEITNRINSLPEEYKKIIQDSPVSIIMLSAEKFYDKFLYDFDLGENVSGLFSHNHYNDNFPNPFIYINKDVCDEVLMLIYFHELGHYDCYINNCICFRNADYILMEIHAYSKELKYSMIHNLDDIFILSYENIIQISNRDPNDTSKHNYHFFACKMMIQDEGWTKIQNYYYSLKYQQGVDIGIYK